MQPGSETLPDEVLDGAPLETLPHPHPHGSISGRVRWFLRDADSPAPLAMTPPGMLFELPGGDRLRPDLALVDPESDMQRSPDGAALRATPRLVVEVMTPASRSRDRGGKRAAYARAGVSELWLIDVEDRVVTVLAGADGSLDLIGTFGDGHQLRSCLLPALATEVSAILP